MDILYPNFNYRYPPVRGGHVHVHQFIQQATRRGHRILLFQPTQRHPLAANLPRGLPRWPAMAWAHAVYARLEDRIELWRYSRVAQWPIKQILRNPLVVWEVNARPAFFSALKGDAAEERAILRVMRTYARDCDLALCVSRKLADYMQAEFNLPRVLVVPNGSDPDHFRVGPPDRAPVPLQVVWMGSGTIAWHGLPLLAQVAEILLERGCRDVQLHLIGELDKAIRWPANVTVHGDIPYAELPDKLAAMDVGLCLYQHELADYLSPLKFYDYLAAGLAVLSTAQPQVTEVLGALGQGDGVVAAEPGVIADRLVEWSGRREEVRARGRAGRARLETHHTWSQAVQTSLDAMENQMKNDAGRTS